MKNFFKSLVLIIISLSSSSCQKVGSDKIFYGSLGLEKKLVITTSSTISGAPFLLLQYDLNGHFEKILYDSTSENRVLKGIAVLDPFQFLISTDTSDGIIKYDVFSGVSQFVSNGNLTGNIFNIRQKKSTGEFFVIETSTIESFDKNGQRVGAPRINNTAIGSCLLSGAIRGMDFTAEGILVVASQGNDDILFYDVSDPNSTQCINANQTLGNVDPVSIVAHSNGYVYIAHASATDSVLRINGDGSGTATPVWVGTTGTNPTAMIELPDGTLLVANDGTNNIIRIDAEGNVLNAPFIQDGFTSYVHDMAIVEVPY